MVPPTSMDSSTSETPLASLMEFITDDSLLANKSLNDTDLEPPLPQYRYSITIMIIIAIIATFFSIITVAGNVMVMISFKIDKQLQTISNYFLFSLAVADFAIGLISMPLFTVSTMLGYWPLGAFVCDTWLALDYLASNASVLNLLIISFDRYFSVTIPLKYRAKRTTTRASIMIGAAWGISLLLWPPWIYSWPYIEGKRTVPKYECYIQFIETNHYITFGTAIAAFYVPVTVMCVLYFKIWLATEKRKKDLPNLQAGKKDSSKRSNSSDETATVNHTGMISQVTTNENYGWRMPRSESSADTESVYLANAVLSDSGYGHHSRRSSTATTGGLPITTPTTAEGTVSLGTSQHRCYGGIKEWCIAWWHSGREDSSDEYGYDQEDPSDLGYATPVSIDTPLQSSVSRCTSLNIIKEQQHQQQQQQQQQQTTMYNRNALGNVLSTTSSDPSHTPRRLPPNNTSISQLHENQGPRDSRSLPSTVTNSTLNNNRLVSRSVSQDSVYTILIRLPPDGGTSEERAPSIKMIHDDVSLPLPPLLSQHQNSASRRMLPSRDSEYSLPIGRRMSHANQDIRIPLNAKIIPKQLGKQNVLQPRHIKKKKKTQEKKQEKKAAKTLSAILLSFILTWTPYNILVLLKPLTSCSRCIPQELWDFFYALCYLNSTINPVCYALCNASFRRTYVRILTCKWHTRNREAMTRGVYN